MNFGASEIRARKSLNLFRPQPTARSFLFRTPWQFTAHSFVGGHVRK